MNDKHLGLVGDDDPNIRQIIRTVLELQGVTVREADDGEEALAAVRQTDFDIIISDNEMPRLSGLGLFAQACKLRPELKERFVFVSGTASPGFEFGSCQVIRKPASLIEVADAVRRIINI